MSDLLKKLMENVSPEVRAAAFKDALHDDTAKHGPIDPLKTAVGTAALEFVMYTPKVRDHLQEMAHTHESKFPCGDLVFVAAMLAGAMAVGENIVEEERKRNGEEGALQKRLALVKAFNMAENVTPQVRAALAHILAGKMREGFTELDANASLSVHAGPTEKKS
jgi:hypothetical protein